jgi:hypothetical protein
VKEKERRSPQGADIYELGRTPETLEERARRMHREAQILAVEEVESFAQVLSAVVEKAEKIRDGGDLFPVGVREQARQVGAMLPQVILTLQSLSERHLREVTGAPMPPVWDRPHGDADS